MKTHEIIYGFIILLKLTPDAIMDIISLLPAILEVKKITAINTKSGEKRLAK